LSHVYPQFPRLRIHKYNLGPPNINAQVIRPTHEQDKRGLLDLLEMYRMQGTGPACGRFCHYPIYNGGQKVTITAS